MRFCECGRTHPESVHKGFGDLLRCSQCNGYILCDFCKGAELDSPFMSIACHHIADSYACWHHAWLGVAKSLSVEHWN